MNKNYIYIEKRQRVALKAGNLPRRALRIQEELEKMQAEDPKMRFSIAYNTEIELSFAPNDIHIHITDIDGQKYNILDFTHIIFGGHNGMKDYEIKQIIRNVVEQHNKTLTSKDSAHIDLTGSQPPNESTSSPSPSSSSTSNKHLIHLQNADIMGKLPYYTKLDMSLLLAQSDLPFIETHYLRNGNYRETYEKPHYPIVVKHYSGENDLVLIEGKNKIKKNVFLLQTSNDWEQERLGEKDPSDFLTQPQFPNPEDLRVFISNGKVVGGWRRRSLDGFMTVGGEREYILENQPDRRVVEICEKTAKLWQADFMALDFMFDQDGNPYILEFSMHPGFHAYETKAVAPADAPDMRPVNIANVILNSFGSGVDG